MEVNMKNNTSTRLSPPITPYLRLDKPKFLSNIDRLKRRLESSGVALRPHLKTVRSIEAAPYLLADFDSPATVSTLAEAEALAKVGYKNFLYAVGVSEEKLPRIKDLMERYQANISVIVDTIEQAEFLASFASESRCPIPVLIELDCDGHRGGIKADSSQLIAIANTIASSYAVFQGVLAHAGESYFCQSPQELKNAAKNEIECANLAIDRLKAHGVECPIVSVGSTPTAFYGEDYTGITEVRAGVYCFFDLVMKHVGVCQWQDIALSVVTTVIGHNEEKGWLITDAGWMALSSDPGLNADCFGLVTDHNGNLIPDMQVTLLNQEHGIIQLSDASLDAFPIGTQLRILPNHACATAAMHLEYQVVDEMGNIEIWNRIKGW
ncbi:alanine racemase [Vibrio nigripulchritudo]|nr:alanine racemase [Vibrio nigripulchritudo]BDU46380.1 alanine racemase [Vibrio nigripulchritudo]